MFTKKQIISAIKITVLSAILIVGLNYANAAWSGPTATAPSGNISAPVNVSSVNQIKNGGLGLNALSVFGDGLFSEDMTANQFCFSDGSCISSWSGIPKPITQTPTVNLTATPSEISYGESTTLSWSSTNATSCSANWTSSTATSGTATKSNLTSSTTYAITCTGAGGTKEVSETVKVGEEPMINYLEATHTVADCESEGGTLTTIYGDSGGTQVCKFSSSSCPSGWNSAGGWSTTEVNNFNWVQPALTTKQWTCNNVTANFPASARISGTKSSGFHSWSKNPTVEEGYCYVWGNDLEQFAGGCSNLPTSVQMITSDWMGYVNCTDGLLVHAKFMKNSNYVLLVRRITPSAYSGKATVIEVGCK